MSLSEKVAGGAVWLAAARIGGQVFGLASTIVVARFVTPDDYGVFAAAMSLLLLVSAFSEFPVSQAIIHLRDVRDEDYDTAFTISLARSALLALVLIILSGPLATFMKDERVGPVVAALAAYTLLLGIRNPRIERFARDMDFTKEAILEVGSKFGSLVAAVIAAIILRSYWALVISICFAALTQVALSFAFAPKTPRITLASFTRLFSYSVWIAGSTIAGQIYQLFDTLMLGRFKGSETLGLYSIGQLVSSRIAQTIAAPPARSLFAAFSQIQAESERVRNAYESAMAFMAVLMAPVILTLIYFAETITVNLLGEQWRSAAPVVQLISVTMLTLINYTPLQALFMGLGLTRLFFFRIAVFLIVYIPAVAWAILEHGLMGMLIVKTALIVLWSVLDMFLARHAIGLSVTRQLLTLLRPAIASGAMLLVYVSLGWIVPTDDNPLLVALPLAFVGALGGLAYLGALAGAWHLSGRPVGAETKLFDMVMALYRRAHAMLAGSTGKVPNTEEKS